MDPATRTYYAVVHRPDGFIAPNEVDALEEVGRRVAELLREKVAHAHPFFHGEGWPTLTPVTLEDRGGKVVLTVGKPREMGAP